MDVGVESVRSVRVSVGVVIVRRIERGNSRESTGVIGLWKKSKGKVMRGEYVIRKVRVGISSGFIYIRLQIIELDFIVIKQVCKACSFKGYLRIHVVNVPAIHAYISW